MASLLWRLEHDRLRLDARTVLIVDEAAMTDDPALLRLLTEAEMAGAKTILVGDHRQLGAIGPAGAFEGLVRRQPDAVHLLRENVRQHDHDERRILAHLRAGDVAVAVDWYADHDRLRAAATRAERPHRPRRCLVRRTCPPGRDAAMFAWRRANVAELNRLARQRWAADGRLTGPELTVAGRPVVCGGRPDRHAGPGRRRPAGHQPDGCGRRRRPGRGHARISAWTTANRFGSRRPKPVPIGSTTATPAPCTAAKATPSTSATGFFDGGGRELAYVSMSRARQHAFVYVGRGRRGPGQR